MKSSHVLLALFAALIITPVAHGQDSATNQDEQQTEIKNKKGHEVATVSETPTGVPVKILVVINEFEGEKKIGSLPYTLYTLTEGPAAPFHPGGGLRESMRYQLRIPIVTGSFQAGAGNDKAVVNNQYMYQDVGTDIDYAAFTVGADSYELAFTVDRSWASVPDSSGQQNLLSTGHPLLPHFRNNFVVMLKDGQTVEGASAADPVSGHVLKVDVTLTVLK